jgi:CheY-like chemotaxis protein
VLVVEDDPIIRENTLELLEFEGFNAIGASDGVEGIQRAQEFLPDIVICDILMPNLDGYGVLAQLRANPLTHAIPLVFVSASPREDILATGKAAGMSDFLVKPFQAPDLFRVIYRLLGR